MNIQEIFAYAHMFRRFKESKEFTVVRSKWQRGYKFGPNSGLLLTEPGRCNGKKCCLGFLATAAGYTDNEIKGLPFLRQVINMTGRNTFQMEFLFDDGDFRLNEDGIGNINDSRTLTDADREASLTAVFAEHGIKVNFVD